MYRAKPATNNATMKRIQREIADCMKEDMGEITLKPSESNMFNWTATLPGPEGSVYEGGVFKLTITLPPDYPFSSPRVTFDTRIYHMNISAQGAICIDVLKGQWSPALSLFKVLLSISSLLTDPNPKDPLVSDIAREYTSNRARHDATAREWTRQYAMPAGPPPAAKDKGKGRAGPSTTTARNQNLTAHRDVIEVLSDDEDSASREPINVDDDEPPVPTGRAPRTRAARPKRAPKSSTVTSSTPTAGTKRRDRPDDDDSGPTTGRTTRSSKRLAQGEGSQQPIIID